ncbi:MAG: hypothetical protein U0441_35730 [Polyangiaceae bacterium]
MSLRLTSIGLALSSVLVASLAATAASAQEAPADPAPAPTTTAAPAGTYYAPPGDPGAAPKPEKRDRVRMRGGIALSGGGLLVPSMFNLGMAGLQGSVGVQINNHYGVYFLPNFDILFGNLGGFRVGSAAIFDYTFMDGLLTAGVGPEASAFIALGGKAGPDNVEVGVSAGALYGARLRFAVNPVIGEGEGSRRKALTIGLDIGLYKGAVVLEKANAGTSGAGGSINVSDFVAAPALYLGYTAF